MKEITKKELKELCNGSKMLSKDELKAVAEILDKIEAIEWRAWKNINGAFAEVNMFAYDDEYIDAELKSGEQDMGDGSSTTHMEQFRIPRDILLNTMSLERKVKLVVWG